MKIKALRFISLTLGAASLSENTNDQISNLEFRVYRVFLEVTILDLISFIRLDKSQLGTELFKWQR
jgi:hypothetical protein